MTYEETKGFLLENGFTVVYENPHLASFIYRYEDGASLRADIARVSNPVYSTFVMYRYNDDTNGKVTVFSEYDRTLEEANDALIEYLMEE